mmetsp:Transcript_66752/g.104254  ORF Transcript_66752/g.104254 Transcript_66752/m.104254 type:complete len:372 (-) Transcript_66752:15-1130(-)
MQGGRQVGYAGMFGVQISGDLGMDRHDLVQQVKAWQRKTEAHKQSWYSFCGQLGIAFYDPHRHEMKNLQEFVGAVESGEIIVDTSTTFSNFAGAGVGNTMPAGGSGDPAEEREKALLVEKVKSFQRQGEMYKDAWHTFVHQQGTSNYDPRRHSNSTLKYFLDLADSGRLDFSASAPPPSSGKGKGGKGTLQGQGMNIQDESNRPPGQSPGDWQCSSCQTINYSYRSTCTACKAASKGAQRVGLKPGDWICPGCGDLVFSSKAMCKMCGTMKPNEIAAAPGAMVAPGQLQPPPHQQQMFGQQQPLGQSQSDGQPQPPQQQQQGSQLLDGRQQQQQMQMQMQPVSQQPTGTMPAVEHFQASSVGMESARVSPY